MPKVTLKISKLVRYSIVILVAAGLVFTVVKLAGVYKKLMWLKETRQEAEANIRGEVNAIQKEILSIEQIPQNLAYVLEFSKSTKNEMKILLQAIVANNDKIYGACIAFEPYKYNKDTVCYDPYLYKRDGRIIFDEYSDTTENYFSKDWYLIPKILNKSVWIEPYYEEGTDNRNIVMTTYSVPFYSFDGTNETMSGIIAIDVSIDWLSKIVSSIKLKKESYSVLVSENGTIISCPKAEWPYNESIFSLADEQHSPALRDVGRNLQQGKSGFVNIGRLGTNRNWWVYYMPIPANKWGVLLLIPED